MGSGSLQLLPLAWGGQNIVVPVPTELFQLATEISKRFARSLSVNEISPDKQPCSAIEVVAHFLGYVAGEYETRKDETADVSSHEALVRSILQIFEIEYLKGRSIHAALHDENVLDTERRLDSIRCYYAAVTVAGRPIAPWYSTLLKDAQGGQDRDASARIYAIFGGQGLTDSYLDDMRELYTTYKPFVHDLLQSSGDTLQSLSKQVSNASTIFPNGIDILAWLEFPEKAPSKEDLLAAPLSFPLIGLLQLASYQITCRIFGMQPGDLRDCLRGTTGHSQGVVTAVAISKADSWEAWTDVVQSTLTILFWIGVRSQQVAPLVPVSPTMLKDSMSNKEGTPTPMLNIRGLTQEDVQKHVNSANKGLRPGNRVAITLINGPRNFVVSGPPLRLYGLCRQLRKAKVATKTSDPQDGTAQITSRYLPVTVPFHSEYLQDAIELIQTDLADVAIDASQLKLPVYSTKTGRDLREEMKGENIIPELCRLITLDILDWPKASEFQDATHVLDFGPGGTHGIGALTSSNRNDDGENTTRVILAGSVCGKSTKVGYQHELFS